MSTARSTTRELDRELERYRQARVASEAPTVPKRARPYDGVAGRQRRGRRAWTKKPAANAYAYKGDWPERRVRVLERDGYQCQLRYADICVGKASQVDHIVQPEAGGGSDPANLRAVCVRCHARRTGRQGRWPSSAERRPRSGGNDTPDMLGAMIACHAPRAGRDADHRAADWR